MKLLDGKKCAAEVVVEIEQKLKRLENRKPGLAFVLVGSNPASQTYVRMKKRACAAIGFHSVLVEMPASIAQSDLLFKIQSLNDDPTIDGILVQLPLPIHIDPQQVMISIDPEKDVDGFHPVNVGKMLLGDESAITPCTPKGIWELLRRNQVQIEGTHVVIVGRSNIVGKPLAAMLMQKRAGCNATVTICHSQSKNLAQIAKTGDILVAAIGQPRFITSDMVKKGAVVVDVGINRVDGVIVGDVEFDSVSKVASQITPVPGGVGPMTIAILLQNTLNSYLRRIG